MTEHDWYHVSLILGGVVVGLLAGSVMWEMVYIIREARATLRDIKNRGESLSSPEAGAVLTEDDLRQAFTAGWNSACDGHDAQPDAYASWLRARLRATDEGGGS